MESKKFNINMDIHIEYQGDTLIIQPGKSAFKYTLIWLHGLAYFPQRFLNLFLTEELIGLLNEFRIVIPQAPIRHCTCIKEETCSWYDVKIRDFSLPFEEQFSKEEIFESEKTIKSLLETEVKLVNDDYTRIFLGGYSQGCAMTYQVAFSFPHQLGGLIGFAGYLFEITEYIPEFANVKIIHGLADKLRPWEECKKTYEKILDKKNVELSLIERMGHDYYLSDSRKAIYDYIMQRVSELKKNQG